MNTDRLAEIAVEFAHRMREEDPEEVAEWLLAETTEVDRWALLFIQAAAGPTSRQGFGHAKAWAARLEPPDVVDDIAVERACRGELVQLTRLEQAAAVKRLHRRGVSLRETARRIGVDRRWISRVRAGHIKYAREVA